MPLHLTEAQLNEPVTAYTRTDFATLDPEWTAGAALAQVAADQAVVSNSLPRAYPFAPVRGFGMGVEDQDGNVFLDCAAGIAGVHIVGTL